MRVPLTRRVSDPGIDKIHTLKMTIKLKGADPTIAPEPSLAEAKLLARISMMLSRMTGADEPRAIRVKLATVSFHMRSSRHSPVDV